MSGRPSVSPLATRASSSAVIEYRAINDTTMIAEIVTWPWWTVVALIILFCVPIQAVVLYGHFKRAVDGGGPGGTVDTHEDASHGGEV